VWFGADVSKDFNPYLSTLDGEVSGIGRIFGEVSGFNKKDRMRFHNVSANHAMTITGVNLGADGKPEAWQVENSWGFWDPKTPGADGFLYMSHSWFLDNVVEIAVPKCLLSRTVCRMLKTEPIILNPWDSIAPALRISPSKQPVNYKQRMAAGMKL
jgi:bleomycin hydrolase